MSIRTEESQQIEFEGEYTDSGITTRVTIYARKDVPKTQIRVRTHGPDIVFDGWEIARITDVDGMRPSEYRIYEYKTGVFGRTRYVITDTYLKPSTLRTVHKLLIKEELPRILGYGPAATKFYESINLVIDDRLN